MGEGGTVSNPGPNCDPWAGMIVLYVGVNTIALGYLIGAPAGVVLGVVGVVLVIMGCVEWDRGWRK